MRKQHIPLVLLIALTTTACAIAFNERPPSIAAPVIRLHADQNLDDRFFGRSARSVPTDVEVKVTNRSSVPLRIREIELASPGMREYRIAPVRRVYNATVAPGETRSITVPATAISDSGPSTSTLAQGPLPVRAIVHFQTNGTQFREIVHQQ